MRIAGKLGRYRRDVIEVLNPYRRFEVVGTVPAAAAEHVRDAFEARAEYKPKLTRYERSRS
jgi:phosphonoacetaldehyde dehydrogenase